MAEEQAEQPQAEAAAPAGGGMLGKIIIAAFMGVVILIECLLAYFWIPSAEDIAAMAEERMTAKIHELNPDEENPLLPDSAKVVEIDFGEYSVTAAQPSTNSSLRIDFKLAGTVEAEKEDDATELFEKHKFRFADNVEFVVRNAEVSDLNDPGLGLIKRRILEKSNRLFGETLVKEILITGFSMVDQ